MRFGAPSFSANRTSERLAYATALIAAVACVVGFAPAFVAIVRRRLSAAHAAAAALCATAGAAPAAIVAFVIAGASAPRLACEPGWLAALPLVAYVALVPALLAAALLVGVAVSIEAVAAISPIAATLGCNQTATGPMIAVTCRAPRVRQPAAGREGLRARGCARPHAAG